MTDEKQPLDYDQVHQLVDECLMKAMRDIGLRPWVAEANDENDKRKLATEFQHLFLVPGTSSLMVSDGVCKGCQVAIEVFYQDPRGNKGVMSLLASRFWDEPLTEDEAIATVTREWVEGTMPPLCRLFGAQIGASPGQLRMESYTEGDDQMTLWEGFLGPMQVWGDESLRKGINAATPYNLMRETFTDYQSLKRLHWVEVSGVRYASGKTQITVEIDGQPDPQACAEANYKFDWTPFPNPGSFRQFIVVRPCGNKPLSEADEQMAQAMKEHQMDTTPRDQRNTSQPAPPVSEKKSKLRWPFGRRSS